MTPKAQGHSSRCWLHCFEMLYQWNGYSAYEVESKLKAANIPTGGGLNDQYYLEAATALGLESDIASSINTAQLLMHRLDTWGPCKVGVLWSDVKHAILVFGVEKDLNQFGFYNTWWENEYTKEDCTKERWCAFSDLVSGMNGRGSQRVVQHWPM